MLTVDKLLNKNFNIIMIKLYDILKFCQAFHNLNIFKIIIKYLIKNI